MTGSFVKRQIFVDFTLTAGKFGDSGSNTKRISGLRVSCEIDKLGSPTKNEARLRIYGMLESDMNQLSTLGWRPLVVRKNLVRVIVGDSDGLSTAFQGEITGAWVNYQKPPDLDFEVHAIAGFYPSIAPARPVSVRGGAPVVPMFQEIAAKMGYGFQNNGVTSVVQSPYLAGSPYDQARSLAQAAGCDFGIDDDVLYITPRGGLRAPKGSVPLITPENGMKGYPIWDKEGLVVESLYNPAFQVCGAVTIANSLVTKANGTWRIHGLKHILSARNPHQSSWISKLHLSKVFV